MIEDRQNVLEFSAEIAGAAHALTVDNLSEQLSEIATRAPKGSRLGIEIHTPDDDGGPSGLWVNCWRKETDEEAQVRRNASPKVSGKALCQRYAGFDMLNVV